MIAALTSAAWTWAMLLMFGFGGLGFAVFSVARRVGRKATAERWKGEPTSPASAARRSLAVAGYQDLRVGDHVAFLDSIGKDECVIDDEGVIEALSGGEALVNWGWGKTWSQRKCLEVTRPEGRRISSRESPPPRESR
jgi:hypothetical protein